MTLSAAISPSDPGRQAVRPTPSLAQVRVCGGVRICAEVIDGASTVTRLHESDGYRARLVRRSDPPEIIVVNTGGGLASGDKVCQHAEVGDRAALTMTTQAAERCYRSDDGTTAQVDVKVSIAENATLNWLPQETILFDRSQLARSIDADLAPTARLLMVETVVFGRRAMSEHLTGGLFTDRWRIRRDGRLIFAENVRLDDTAYAAMARAPRLAMAQGAHAVVTLLLAASDAEDMLPRVRGALAGSPFECAASAWDEKLVMRGLATKPEDIRHLMQSLIPALGGPPLPRTWST